jgi:hypothetical protein
MLYTLILGAVASTSRSSRGQTFLVYYDLVEPEETGTEEMAVSVDDCDLRALSVYHNMYAVAVAVDPSDEVFRQGDIIYLNKGLPLL